MVAENIAVDQKRTKVVEVNDALNDHLQRHRDKLDPAIDRHEKALFGEDGCGGLANSYTVTKNKLEGIEKNQDDLKASFQKLIDVMIKIGVGIILALVSAGIGFMVTG